MANRPPAYAFLTNKGGGRKSVTARETASALARRGITSCVVDMDPQGNVTGRLAAFNPQRAHLGQVLDLKTPQAASNALTVCGWSVDTDNGPAPHPEAAHIYVLQSNTDLADREHETYDPKSLFRLRIALNAIDWKALGVQVILIDSPPGKGHLVYMIIAALNGDHDAVYLPVTPDSDEIDGALRMAGFLGVNRDVLGVDSLRIGGVIINGVDRRLKLGASYIADMADTFETADNGNRVPVLSTHVPQMSVIRTAQSEKLPLSHYLRRERTAAKAIQIYDQLTEEMKLNV